MFPVVVGQSYFFRTVTYHVIGTVREQCGSFVVLDNAAWVAESGRFADAMKSGNLSEVEPVPDGWFVNLEAIADGGPWNHPLPLAQK